MTCPAIKGLLRPSALLLATACPVGIGCIYLLAVSWSSHEQLAFGWYSPLLILILLFRCPRGARFEAGKGGHGAYVGLGAACFASSLFVVCAWIFTSSPDWRLTMWLGVLAAVVTQLGCVTWIYGAREARRQASAWSLMFFCIPWPTALEGAMGMSLILFVSAATAEILMLFGRAAQNYAAMVELASWVVAVEEG